MYQCLFHKIRSKIFLQCDCDHDKYMKIFKSSNAANINMNFLKILIWLKLVMMCNTYFIIQYRST